MTRKVNPGTIDWPVCRQFAYPNGAADYWCSGCGTLLLHSKVGFIPNLLIVCIECEATNSTDA